MPDHFAASLRARPTCFSHVAVPCAAAFHQDPVPAMPVPVLSQGLGMAQCQDLADLLPFLACGEESAAHVFGGKLADAMPGPAQGVLARIADDERRHAALLEALRRELPAPRALVPARRLAFFFRRLDVADPVEHLARVAALDLAVCRLLQPLLAAGTALCSAPLLHGELARLRQDEARHVRLSRSLAQQLGCSVHHQVWLNSHIAARLDRLLAPVSGALQRLAHVQPMMLSLHP